MSKLVSASSALHCLRLSIRLSIGVTSQAANQTQPNQNNQNFPVVDPKSGQDPFIP